MACVSLFEVFCASDVFSRRLLVGCDLVYYILLYTGSVQGAFVFPAALAVTFLCIFYVGFFREKFLVMCLEDCFHVSCATVRQF